MSRYIRLNDTLIDKNDIVTIYYNPEYNKFNDYYINVLLQNGKNKEFDCIREDWLREEIEKLEDDFRESLDYNIIQITTGTYINLNKISTAEIENVCMLDNTFIARINITWKDKINAPCVFALDGDISVAHKILNVIQERG